MNAVLNWLDDRTGYKTLVHEALYERIPGGARWRYVWGSTLVYTFLVQLITGFFLWTAYSPSAQSAWESVYYIQYVMQFGWLVRGLHHYTAQAMVVLLVLHLMQVIIDGAYKAPREVNFWLGLILMQIVLGLSLTGYLLPWDQKGYWATQVATNIAGLTPVFGAEIQRLAAGGASYGHHTLTTFFALHAGLLPALLIGFLGLHIYVFRRHGITVPDPARNPTATFWPDQVLKDGVACLAVLATVLLFVFWKGADLGAPADATEQYKAARPEWYFLFLFQFLKLTPLFHEYLGLSPSASEMVGAMVVPGFVMTVLFLMPFIAYLRIGHRFNVAFMFLVIGGAVGLTAMALYQDSTDPDFKASVVDAEHSAVRVRELVSEGIDSRGAAALLRDDPKIQGGKIFAKSCTGCHHYDGKDGTGKPVTQIVDGKLEEAVPKAADLGKFGSAEWIRAVLLDFKGHFKDTDNLKDLDGQPITEPITAGSMAEWSATNGSKMTADELDSVVALLLAQNPRPGETPPNPDLVAKGKKFFEEGSDAVPESCSICHTMLAVGDKEPFATGDSGPDLTGYGSDAWLKSFIANPKKYYGKRNAMPAQNLSEHDMQLLVDWMRHNWFEPASKSSASAH